MDLTQLSLSQLTILWQVSVRNPEFRRLVETELQLRIENNRNFSREFIYHVCRILNHALTIIFIPTSQAFIHFGNSITIDLILNEEETVEILRNIAANPPINTYGQVKARLLVADNFSQEQNALLSEQGFNTGEILETLHL